MYEMRVLRDKNFIILTLLFIFLIAVFYLIIPGKTVFAQGPLAVKGGGAISSFFGLDKIAGDIFKGIGFLLLQIGGVLLWLAGTLFTLSVEFSILYFKSFVESITAINAGWEVIRDLINMGFIFVLLYIAITTILDIGKGKRGTIVSLIIAALLINFSLFFTKVVIDASNIIALQFYEAIAPARVENANPDSFLGALDNLDGGISDVFMDGINAASVYSSGDDLEQVGDAAASGVVGDDEKSVLVMILGSVFLTIMAFIFFSAAILFIVRFILLIILMILSPVAFLGLMLPKFKGQSDKWWKTLIDQSFFAPVFMVLIYLVATIIQSEGFGNLAGEASLADAFAGQGSIVIILNFVIVAGLAVAALVISKGMMANTAKGAVNWATKTAGRLSFGTAGLIGRQTIGRGATALSKSEAVQKAARRIPFGRQLYGGLKGVSGASFDARGTGLVSGIARGQGIQLGGVGRKGGFEEYKKEKQKKIEQFDKDTKKGREAIEKEADDKLRKEGIKTIGLFKNKAGQWMIKNPYSDKATGSFIPNKSKEKIEGLIEDFERGEKSIQKLREEVYNVIKEDIKGGSRMEEVEDLVREKSEKKREEERMYDPYSARLRRGSETLRGARGLGPAYGWLRDSGLIAPAEQAAVEKIRQWKHMSKTERLLSDLKSELEKNTKLEEKQGQKEGEAKPKEDEESTETEDIK